MTASSEWLPAEKTCLNVAYKRLFTKAEFSKECYDNSCTQKCPSQQEDVGHEQIYKSKMTISVFISPSVEILNIRSSFIGFSKSSQPPLSPISPCKENLCVSRGGQIYEKQATYMNNSIREKEKGLQNGTVIVVTMQRWTVLMADKKFLLVFTLMIAK